MKKMQEETQQIQSLKLSTDQDYRDIKQGAKYGSYFSLCIFFSWDYFLFSPFGLGTDAQDVDHIFKASSDFASNNAYQLLI